MYAWKSVWGGGFGPTIRGWGDVWAVDVGELCRNRTKSPFCIILDLLYIGFGAGGNLVENGRFRLTICLPFERRGNGEWKKSLFWAY